MVQIFFRPENKINFNNLVLNNTILPTRKAILKTLQLKIGNRFYSKNEIEQEPKATASISGIPPRKFLSEKS